MTGCAGDQDPAAGSVPAETSADAQATGEPSAGTPSSSASSASPTAGSSATPSQAPSPKPAELPRGGVELFPDYRLVGFSGHPYSEALGRLGIGPIDERVDEMEQLGSEYQGDRKVLPVLELITVVVQASPGDDGKYRTRTSDEIISEYLEAARRHDGILLLNVQPGRSSMEEEVRALEKWLTEPDVSVALDPEWDIDADGLPGQSYGHTGGAEIDAVAGYLDGLVTEHKLPQKPLIYHQVAPGVVSDETAIQAYDGVEVIKSVDGIGAPGAKIDTYNLLMEDLSPNVHAGFKLFFEEDVKLGPLMKPAEVLALAPQPEYVLYE